ncbi:hypothetical protein [Bradyrhizobium japonicum]|uniref:hypothetical protein n=1 Tax=Bradyrhizobium japonicum TaxID=375 RepID=UPI000B1B19D3|nr:hypothetical protein [Bradyrhizobium japonicum]
MRSSPSIVPADRLDRVIYLVLEDFGARVGCADSLSRFHTGLPLDHMFRFRFLC